MKADLRKSGIEIIGEVPWGMHLCQFYQGKEELIEILVPYFKQGLENNEFCMWVTSEPLNVEDAKKALKEKVKNLDDYIKKSQIEILDYSQWYTKTGRFDADKVLEGWVEKEEQAVERGFDGLRLTGNTFWLENKDWENFANYEAIVNSVIGKHRMLAICSYSLDKCKASEIVDVVNNHQFAIIRKEGEWVSLESSERKRMEEALRESEDKYRLITENTSDYISIMKFDGTLIYVNPSHKQLGYEPEDLLGKSGVSMVHPEDKIKLLPLLNKYVLKKITELLKITEEKKSERINFRFPDKSGNWHYFEATTNLIKNPVGGGYNILLISRDITECKKTEEEYKMVLRTTIDGFWITDMQGRFLDVNDAYCRLIGYSRDELLKMRISDVEAAERPEETAQHIQKIMTVGGDRFETRHRCKDGKIVDIEISVNYTKEEGGRLFLFIREITERKELELQLQKEMQNLERFNKLAVERELRMVELKKRIEELEESAGKTSLVNPDEK